MPLDYHELQCLARLFNRQFVQYLELAYYVVYGRCPDQRSPVYILGEDFGLPKGQRRSWAQMYKDSETQLRVTNKRYTTSEECSCFRTGLKPGQVKERRTFKYRDIKVRAHASQGYALSAEAQQPGWLQSRNVPLSFGRLSPAAS